MEDMEQPGTFAWARLQLCTLKPLRLCVHFYFKNMDVTAARKRRERYFDKGEPFVVPPTTAYGRKHERDRTLMTSAESLVDSSSNSTQHSDAAPVLAQRNTAVIVYCC